MCLMVGVGHSFSRSAPYTGLERTLRCSQCTDGETGSEGGSELVQGSAGKVRAVSWLRRFQSTD